nr:HAMP domain-containing sensor histidine kinase [Leifsonia aquatica]
MADRRGRRRPASLTGRIVLVTFAVALIAVLVTAVVSVQVVQSVAESQARQQLKAQATALVADAATTSTRLDRLTERLAVLGDRFAVVSADGTVSGPARSSVDQEVVRELQQGRAVSTTTTLGGKDAVLVGIPSADGAVVGVRRVADIAAGNAELIRWIIVALAIGLAVATVAGALLARRLGRPMSRLAAGAGELARGHRGVVIADQRVAEIDEVAQALRTLDAALSTSEERQREFLLSVSHEIRTPLTAIRGYAEALADGVVPPGEATRIGAVLTAESERLRRFVDDLLELARLEADDFAIDPQRFDARATVERAAQAWAAACVGRRGGARRAAGRGAPRRDRRDAAAAGGGRPRGERPARHPVRCSDRARRAVRRREGRRGGPRRWPRPRGGRRRGRVRARRPARPLPGCAAGRDRPRPVHRAAAGPATGRHDRGRGRAGGRGGLQRHRPRGGALRSSNIPLAQL